MVVTLDIMAKIIKFDLPFNKSLNDYLAKEYPRLKAFRILSRNLDARGAQRDQAPRYNYQIEMIEQGEIFSVDEEVFPQLASLHEKPIIVGTGPAGLFCALRFLEYGITSVLIERGEPLNERIKSIAHYWKSGEMNPESNICFGLGGAGLYSDGKLTSRSKSPYVDYVMKKLVEFGAPSETRWIKNPHIGSNNIRKIIISLCQYLQAQGCEIHFNHKMTGLLIEHGAVYGVEINHQKKMFAPNVILATGHSARDVYAHLFEVGVHLQKKDFAVGLRVEHPRKYIDQIQYGKFAGHPNLKTASYRLSHHDEKSNRGVFSFCMCPGGLILSSGNEPQGIVTNGMSNAKCMSPWSNSALVVSVKGTDLKDDIFSGIKFQQAIERAAFDHSRELASGKEIPAQMLGDFLEAKKTTHLKNKSSTPSGVFPCDLSQILPDFVCAELRKAILKFNQQMKNFISGEAVVLGPETRTSSPVQVLRDRQSLEANIKGLYPIGEGAGWAGGIVSSAIDGIHAAMSIIKKEKQIDLI